MQRIADLIDGTGVGLVRGDPAARIAGITDDSRQVKPGWLFVARVGARNDGRAFVHDAIGRGAAAVLCQDPRSPWDESIPMLLAADVEHAAADISRRFFHNPSRSLRLIGITGTNGKTTTAYIIRHLLEHAGLHCGLMGTVEIDDGAARHVADLTTPGVIEVNQCLARMVSNGCKAAVMEVSSHALSQGRVAGLRFDAAIFTNLSGDHLDYHGTLEEYAAAKAILFRSLDSKARAIVNIDDPFAPEMLRECAAGITACSTKAPAAGSARIIEMTASFTRAEFTGPWGNWTIDLPMVGAHNVANALHALAACAAVGAPTARLRDGLAGVKAPPGRLEPVTGIDDEFAVFVDYAHSDAALENVLGALRPLVPQAARLWTVFGCGGDRDRTKRPRMAAVACALSDRVIITSDNPRTEDPLAIIAEIMRGVPAEAGPAVVCLPDRRQAIAEAVLRARRGDVVLIAGKGHEDYQIVGTRKQPFDDRIVAREALRARRGALIAA